MRKRIALGSAIAAFAVVALMLGSGASVATQIVPVGQATGTSSTWSSVNYPSVSPTYVGPVAKFVSGPYKVTAAEVAAGTTFTSNPSLAKHSSMPNINTKPGLSYTGIAAGANLNLGSVPPVVSCSPVRSAGCDVISSSNGGAVTHTGLGGADLLGMYGTSVEPPDQGMCAGNGFVMEIINIGQLQVWNSNFAQGTSQVSLDSLMGLTALGWSSGGDISCLYDANNGGHWFITEFVSKSPESAGGTFAGCFAAVKNACLEGLAVSATNDPRGAYNVYFLDPNQVNHNPGRGYLLNDFAKIGNTRDAFLLFYDEFNQNGATIPPCPAYGCFGFNGAQEFAINKKALELGWPVSEPFGGANPFFNVAYVNLGKIHGLQPPGGKCYAGPLAGANCWIQAIPAASPDPTQFDNSNGGMGFILAALDLFGGGDNRIMAFDWSGLHNLLSYGCSTCGSIGFGGTLFTGLLTYMNEGQNCPASTGGNCGLSAQRSGPIPLGKNCVSFGLAINVTSCPVGGIATNGDEMTQVSYAQGNIWGAVSTLIDQKFGNGKCGGTASCEIHTGAAYYVIGTGSGGLSFTDQGYVSPQHEDIQFPSFAAGDNANEGTVISYSLSGNGGPTAADNGGYFPSSAFGWVTESSHGLVSSLVYVSAKGKGTQDGFSEYQGLPGPIRPRWGDYGAAIFVPGTNGGRFYFATEMISFANCKSAAFLVDPSCGGTRAPYANFGTSVNYVT